MAGMTVGEVQAALPSGTVQVAGSTGLDREVSWPSVLRTRPPAFQSLRGGEFLLISSAALHLLDPGLTLARLLQSVAQAKVAAAAIVGEIPADAAELADSAGLPLYALPENTSLPDLERELSRSIVEWQAETQRRWQEISREFTELALEGRGVAAIAQALSRATGLLVAFEDRFGSLSLFGQPTTPDLEAAFHAGQPALQAWLRGRRLSGSEPPIEEFPLDGVGLRRLCAPILLRDGVVGYLSLGRARSAFRELERVALGRAAAACAIEVLRESAALDAEDRVGATFLDELIAGDVVSPERIRRLASRLGYDLRVPQIVLAIQRHSRRPPAAVTNGDAAAREFQTTLDAEFSRRQIRCLARAWDERAAVLYSTPGSLPRTGELQELVRGIGSRLGDPVSAGVSRLASGPEGIPVAYREAQGALTLGVRLFGPGRVTSYGDLGVYRLLLELERSPELPSFYQEVLGKLEANDRRGDGELIRTLEAYFASRNSPTEAAERLHLHRNTLLYRLRRIQTITGLDLDDPETRLALHLALRVGQVLGKGR